MMLLQLVTATGVLLATVAIHGVASASLVYDPRRCSPPAIKSENRKALSSRDTIIKKGFRSQCSIGKRVSFTLVAITRSFANAFEPQSGR